MRVLFVCYGNICRSPMAEALFREAIRARPDLSHVEVGSAGVGAWPGNRAAGPAIAVMREDFDLDLKSHRARRLDDALPADVIVALDDLTLTLTRETIEDGRADTLGNLAGTGENVADPYGEPVEVYRACARQIQRLVVQLADTFEL